MYAACLILPATSFFLFRTRPGLLLRAVGEQATAADSAGVAVVGIRIAAMTFGGLMAGVAGAYLSIVATSGVFIDNMTLGRGFLAIAITIFGRWKPYRVALAALLFGAAEALQFSSQVSRRTRLPSLYAHDSFPPSHRRLGHHGRGKLGRRETLADPS